MKTLSQLMAEEYQNRTELFKDIFSEKLRNIRAEKNYSQKTVAKKLGVPVSTYANWEQGRREPSIYDIFNLMWVYEIDANELFNIDDIF
ncbi:MAG: hypothetical protein DBX59_05170 [Bacillota bacterium]|nr:MAG: hypothetical protein DBX59_05170 [Bacillota bacterium]